MQVSPLTPSDPRWRSMLDAAPHDVYQLPGYVALAGRVDGGDPIAVLVEDGPRRLLLPLLLRDLPAGLAAGTRWRDAISPYGYPGLAVDSVDPAVPADDHFTGSALQVALGWLREAGVVSLFLRMNPLLPVDEAVLAGVGVVVRHGRTVSIDLRRDEADLFPALRTNHRRNIARLEQLGFTYEIDSARNPASIAEFLAIYTETMNRLGAATSYYVDERYLGELDAALDGRLAVALAWQANVAVAAALFTEVAGIVQYHLGGTRTAFLSLSPNKGIIARAAVWARARGNRVLHLGGGVGGVEDALFDFKAGFSPERHVFQTVRIVVEEPAYAGLLAAWSAATGRAPLDVRSFFPGYRAPLPSRSPKLSAEPAGRDVPVAT